MLVGHVPNALSEPYELHGQRSERFVAERKELRDPDLSAGADHMFIFLESE